jgi:hypothetical protein
MTTKHITPIALLLTLALVACSDSDGGGDGGGPTGPGDDGSDGGDGSGTADDGGTDGGTGSDDGGSGTDTPPPPAVRVCGSAVDDAGAVILQPGIQFCGPIVDGVAEQCVLASLDDEGNFCVVDDEPGDWNLKVVPPPVDPTIYSGAAILFSLADGDWVDLPEPVVVTRVGEITMLEDGSNDVVIDDSLTVTLDPASINFGLGVDPQLAGAAVAEEHWLDLAPAGEHIVAHWTFYPFGVKAEEGEMTLTITSALGLDPGTAVTVHEMDKEIAALTEAATGTVNAGGDGIDLDGGVHELSWIIVTTPD